MSSGQPLTVQQLEYPWHLRLINGFARVAEQAGLGLGQLHGPHIRAAARRRTGLQDWGDDSFLEPMDLLIDEVRSKPFTPMARAFTRATLLKAVENRLHIVDHRARHLSITKLPIERPVFVLGFPRTGTTLLQNLLSLAPGRRGLQFWELTTPYPVKTDPVADVRARTKISDRMLFMGNLVAPEMQAVHTVRSDTFEECWPLFTNSFSVLNFDLQHPLPRYGDWLLNADMRAPYRFYRDTLQVLQSQQPDTQLLLKCPEHLWFVDALFDTFPDACVVWTHRDPLASVASYCSLMTLPRRMLLGRAEPEQLGADITDRFVVGVQRAMEVRADAPMADKRFFDVRFQDLLADPRAVVHNICDHFDLDHDDAFDAEMRTFLDTKREDARGKHIYSAERYGLQADTLYERFAPYIDRFDIALGG